MTGGSEPRYVISIAARMLGVHTHTLRYYERVGLLEPARSESNLRLYSDQDIERLRRIRTLMDELERVWHDWVWDSSPPETRDS